MELMQVVCTVAIGKTFARPVVKIWNFLPAHIADFSILTCFDRLLPIFFQFYCIQQNCLFCLTILCLQFILFDVTCVHLYSPVGASVTRACVQGFVRTGAAGVTGRSHSAARWSRTSASYTVCSCRTRTSSAEANCMSASCAGSPATWRRRTTST